MAISPIARLACLPARPPARLDAHSYLPPLPNHLTSPAVTISGRAVLKVLSRTFDGRAGSPRDGRVRPPSRMLRRCWFVLCCCSKDPRSLPLCCLPLKLSSVFCFEQPCSVGSACQYLAVRLQRTPCRSCLAAPFVPPRMHPPLPPAPSALLFSAALSLVPTPSFDPLLVRSSSARCVVDPAAPSLRASLHTLCLAPILRPLLLFCLLCVSFIHRPHPSRPHCHSRALFTRVPPSHHAPCPPHPRPLPPSRPCGFAAGHCATTSLCLPPILHPLPLFCLLCVCPIPSSTTLSPLCVCRILSSTIQSSAQSSPLRSLPASSLRTAPSYSQHLCPLPLLAPSPLRCPAPLARPPPLTTPPAFLTPHPPGHTAPGAPRPCCMLQEVGSCSVHCFVGLCVVPSMVECGVGCAWGGGCMPLLAPRPLSSSH